MLGGIRSSGVESRVSSFRALCPAHDSCASQPVRCLNPKL